MTTRGCTDFRPLAILAAAALVAFGLGAAGCATDSGWAGSLPEGRSALREVVNPADWPDLRAAWHDRDGTDTALAHSLDWLDAPSSRTHFPVDGITHADVRRSLERLRVILRDARSAEEFDRRVRAGFRCLQSVGRGGTGEVLVTGYYRPVMRAARERTGEYVWPIYRPPADLLKAADGTPEGRQGLEGTHHYYTRHEIDHGLALQGRGLELAWMADPLQRYILHVQGSGVLQMPDGERLEVGYAGKTDRPYVGLGRSLVEDGRLAADELSLPAVVRFFRDHPDLLRTYMERNESYVFFTESRGGPYGSLGVPVTDQRTIATDKSIFPRALPVVLEARLPRRLAAGPQAGQWVDLPRTVLGFDQDTGGAIRSPGRCDFYWGTGDGAGERAGRTHTVGALYYLVARRSPPTAVGAR